jgi:hypothetical protein
MERVTAENLQKFARDNVVVCSPVYSDEHHGYGGLDVKFQHHTSSIPRFEYVRGEVRTNTVEGYFSLLQRGVMATRKLMRVPPPPSGKKAKRKAKSRPKKQSS